MLFRSHFCLTQIQTLSDRQQFLTQLLWLVSARASHQATTPDEDALLCLYVFSLTLRADPEGNETARINRAYLTTGYALVSYSTPAPLHACKFGARAAQRQMWGVACAFRRRAVVRLENRLPLSSELSLCLLPHKFHVLHNHVASAD